MAARPMKNNCSTCGTVGKNGLNKIECHQNLEYSSLVCSLSVFIICICSLSEQMDLVMINNSVLHCAFLTEATSINISILTPFKLIKLENKPVTHH